MRPRRAWTCEVCGKPIRAGAGYVELFNANADLGRVGSYPCKPSREFDEVVEARDPSGNMAIARSLTDLVAIENDPLYQPNIGWRAVHRACDDRPEVSGYWIAVERLTTLSRWIDLVLHVGEKSWMGKRDILELLPFWFTNRGTKPDVA